MRLTVSGDQILARVLDTTVSVCNIERAAALISEMVWSQTTGYICLENVHMCVEARRNPSLRQAVNNASYVFADGIPIVWYQKLMGYRQSEQVRGEDLTHALCDLAVENGLELGLLGSDLDTLGRMSENLEAKYDGLKIVFKCSPPFRELTEEEERVLIEKINDSGAKILFVGLGCPKQEIWMLRNNEKLETVSIGIGAVFDFISGKKVSAPLFIRRIGLEWLYRFAKEPKRLWRRYLITNSLFIWYLFNKHILFR